MSLVWMNGMNGYAIYCHIWPQYAKAFTICEGCVVCCWNKNIFKEKKKKLQLIALTQNRIDFSFNFMQTFFFTKFIPFCIMFSNWIEFWTYNATHI